MLQHWGLGLTAILQAVHPVLAARDVATAVRFYEALGFRCTFLDSAHAAHYACVVRDQVELHLQWADPGQWIDGQDRPVFRFLVDAVDALYREFQAHAEVHLSAAQASPYAAPRDTPWGTREFHLRDPDGNGLQFYAPRP